MSQKRVPTGVPSEVVAYWGHRVDTNVDDVYGTNQCKRFCVTGTESHRREV